MDPKLEERIALQFSNHAHTWMLEFVGNLALMDPKLEERIALQFSNHAQIMDA
ncbi:hypothetical protein [Treponema sp.]|uniref:hypothetical protein n=1 Tax=Treponema sp. TaxID=166 RepID=UPI00298D88F2|nr:hypothetical protein [Treponema sp.]MCR5614360.1 hypothetical protein [Treponema sp.]